MSNIKSLSISIDSLPFTTPTTKLHVVSHPVYKLDTKKQIGEIKLTFSQDASTGLYMLTDTRMDFLYRRLTLNTFDLLTLTTFIAKASQEKVLNFPGTNTPYTEENLNQINMRANYGFATGVPAIDMLGDVHVR